MNERHIFVLAGRALNEVVAQIRDDQWDTRVPESFARSRRDTRPTIRDIVNYHAYEDST